MQTGVINVKDEHLSENSQYILPLWTMCKTGNHDAIHYVAHA